MQLAGSRGGMHLAAWVRQYGLTNPTTHELVVKYASFDDEVAGWSFNIR